MFVSEGSLSVGPVAAGDESANLCIACGLCCDGTLFQDVPVDERDRVTLQRLDAGFAYGTSSFPQPCWALMPGGCSIYDNRPAACRNERCLLLRRWEAGEIPYEHARELIASTIALRDAVRSEIARYLGSDRRDNLANLYDRVADRFESSADPGAVKRDHAPMLADMQLLRSSLAEHFGGC